MALPEPATSHSGARAQDFWLANLSTADAYTRWILDEVQPWLGHRILEVGCGTGNFTVPLAAAGHELVGIDVDPEYAEATARRTAGFPTVTIRHADVNDTDFPLGEGFDSVVMFDVLEHIEHDLSLLEILLARLKPGGHVVLKVPAIKALHSPMDDAIGHWRRYDRATLTKALSMAGFELVKLWRFNAFAVPGWWLNGCVLKRQTPPAEQLRLFNALIPVLRPLDHVFRHVTGLSYFAIGRRPFVSE
jgi:SAM-dependent methyltransferase